MEIYNTKIYIVVQSKYPDMLESFKETFFPTTNNFKNLLLAVENDKEYGAKVINKHIGICRLGGYQYFGVFNDDLWFADGWLDGVIPFFDKHQVVSAGYVETADRQKYLKAVELTKNEDGYVPHLYGPNAIFDIHLFKKIGLFDERYDWTCDDLDFAWRLKLNGLSSITLKKITCAHFHGQTRNNTWKEQKAWRIISKENKQRFYQKHGYESYKHIRDEYRTYHKYFSQFK